MREIINGGEIWVHISDYKTLETRFFASNKAIAALEEKLEDHWKVHQAFMELLADEKHKVAVLEARCRENEGLLSRVNNCRGADFKRISDLEAFLNLCYEEKMIPTSDDLDALKVPVRFSDSAKETPAEPLDLAAALTSKCATNGDS